MSAELPNQHHALLSEIDKAKRRYQKIVTINRLMEDNCSIPKDERITALTMLLKEMLDAQTNSQRNTNQLQQTISSMQNEISIKDKMIEKYKTQLLQQKDDYFVLEGKFKHTANQLKSAQAQIIVQQELIDHQKMASTRKVLSMQNQVNYLLTKDCQKAVKKQERKLSNLVEYKQNGCSLKKKGHASRKSLAK